MEREEEQARKVQDAIRKYLGLTEEDLEGDTEPQSWEEHDKAVEAAEEQEDINEPTNIELLDAIVHLTLLDLNAGAINVENGRELLDTVQAVALLEQLKSDV